MTEGRKPEMTRDAAPTPADVRAAASSIAKRLDQLDRDVRRAALSTEADVRRRAR
jgi:hypothetical protein